MTDTDKKNLSRFSDMAECRRGSCGQMTLSQSDAMDLARLAGTQVPGEFSETRAVPISCEAFCELVDVAQQRAASPPAPVAVPEPVRVSVVEDPPAPLGAERSPLVTADEVTDGLAEPTSYAEELISKSAKKSKK